LKVAKDLDNEAYRALIESRVALNEGHPKRALALLDKVFPVWPDNAGARYYAARAAEQIGDFGRAIEEYRQSIRSAPDETEAGLRLAKLYLAAGAFEDAWSTAGQYVNVHRDDPEGVRVMVAAAARDEKANLQGLFNQLRGSMLLPFAMAARARFVADVKDPAAALAWMDGIAMPARDWTHPVHAELLRTKVLLLQEAKRTKDAEKAIADALAAHPDSTQFLEIQAALLEAQDADPGTVRAAFEKAVERDAKNWRAVEGIARSFERAGDDARAIELYDRSTKLHPESPEAARKATLLVAKTEGSGPEVEKRWIELLKEHPWDAKAAQALAEMRSARNELGEATLDLAERAVMFGGGESAQTLLVHVHEARGEKERAQQVAQAFKEGKPIPPRKAAANAAATASEPATAPKKES
jgi:tetratricopeptide (TPR) repeat protein